MDRYDVLTVRESNGKSYFTKLGVMFQNKSGDGFTLFLDAMPAPTEGQYKLIVKPPQERSQTQQRREPGGVGPQDEAPF